MREARGLAGLLGVAVLAGGLVWPAVGPPSTGTIEGVVRFTGKPPPPRRIITADGPVLHHDLGVDKKTKGLRDVVVCLADAPARPRVKNRPPVRVDQKGLRFVPRVVALQHGQAVRFDNNDRFDHSVRATSTTRANNFNLFVAPGRPIDQLLQPQKPPVAIGCSLHAGMTAWVYVFEHPHFAVTDDRGTFRIGGVRPGKYTLWLRHADTGLNGKRAVEVRGTGTTSLRVEWNRIEE